MGAAPPPPVLQFRPLGLSPWVLCAGAFVFLALVMALGAVARRRKEARMPVTGGEVVGIVGRPGSGKTYLAVRLAYSKLKAGARVATNFSMSLPPELAERWMQFEGWESLADLQDCVIILDEAHLIAPSVQGFVLPEVARWKLSQVRRFGCDLYWVTQNEMRVSKTLRDLTNYIWLCNSFRGGKSFKATLFEPENLRKKDKHLEIRRWKFSPEIGALFDSWEILGGVETKDPEAQRRIAELSRLRNQRRVSGADRAAGRPDDRRPVEVESVNSSGGSPT